MHDDPASLRKRPARRIAGALACVFLLHALPAAAQSFDNSAFDSLLHLHVSADGLVDYNAFEQSADFRAYRSALADAAVAALQPGERLALWINAYNAYTIQLINRHGERRSIRNINRTLGFFRGKGPWSEDIARVGGTTYTLDQIEHEIIRQRFREPRIHFALVCAALGCPPLRREAYDADRLDAQLDEQARAFLLRSPGKNRIDLERRIAYLSPIFKWYPEDFGTDATELLRYLAGFFPAGPERAMLEAGDLRIEYTAYDWNLNSQDHGSSGY